MDNKYHVTIITKLETCPILVFMTLVLSEKITYHTFQIFSKSNFTQKLTINISEICVSV